VSVAVAITGAGSVTAPSLDDLDEAVRTRATRAERISQLALAATDAALLDAGLRLSDGEPRAGIGIVVGTAFGCFLTNAAFQHRVAAGGPAAASPRLFAATVSNASAGEIGVVYRLGGPAVTLTAGAAAGLVALGHAADLLRAGQARGRATAASRRAGAPRRPPRSSSSSAPMRRWHVGRGFGGRSSDTRRGSSRTWPPPAPGQGWPTPSMPRSQTPGSRRRRSRPSC
jgi:hypothetical protein